jgi:hypothetical protein
MVGMRQLALLSVLVCLVLAAPAAAQQQVRVEGRVVDHEGRWPLSYADITVRRPDGQFVRQLQADSLGRFEFVVSRTSSVQLRVARLGYRTNTTPVLHFDDKKYFQVEVRLDAEAILLAPLEVMVWSEVDRSPFLDNFRRRVQNGLGIYITRRDIEERRPAFVSDLLRTVPGLQVSGSGRGARPSIQIGRSAGMRCYTQIFVDGLLMNPWSVGEENARLDDFVSPNSVEGIEIYRGLSTVPPEFLTPEAECGVIAVWTRRGGAAQR